MSKQLLVKINNFLPFVKLLLMTTKNLIHVQRDQAKILMISSIKIMIKLVIMILIINSNKTLEVKNC